LDELTVKRLFFAICGIFAICVVGLGVLFAARRSCPALVRIRTEGLPETHHILILNPLRSRKAERSAEAFLGLLQTKDVLRVYRAFPLIDKKKIEFDVSDPPVDWKLDDVVESENGTLGFKFFYAPAHGSERDSNIWIYCVRDKLGNWTVSRYDRVF